MTTTGHVAPDGAHGTLLPALLADAPRMNVFRLCELIELSAPRRLLLGTTESPADEPLRFRSSGRLGFPGREIDTVERDADCPDLPPVVRTTFLGLYGVDARMPSYFVDEIAQRRDGAEPLAAFLDLFHHRTVTQFYRVGYKYRYPVGFRRDGEDKVSRCLLGLVGLGIGGSGNARSEVERIVGTRKLLSMLGLGSQRTRTAEGLAGVLQHAVPDAHITVEEFHPVWVRLDANADAFGVPLGEACLLGRGFHERANTVRVVIAPRTRESVVGLMPGRAVHREVTVLLRFYLGGEARAALEMHVPAGLMPDAALPGADAGLGYTTQLKGAPPDAITRVRLGMWEGSLRQPSRTS